MTPRRNRLITTKVAAELLGVSQDYIRRLCLDGKIKAEKIGHDWLLYERSLADIKRKRALKDKKNGISEDK